jgi:UDP-GlcNAc:undecaprenyl-phosphate GlcNAc-1-phosphate transferase
MLMLAVLISFVVSVIAVRLLSGRFATYLAMDLPNQRSLHTQPVPRTGGLGVMAGVLCGLILANAVLLNALWLGAAALILLSFLDDRYGLPTTIRFLVHGLIATWLVMALGVGGGWVVLAVLVIVWMTNLYNFMDGSDGLAGGMALFGFGAYALAAYFANDVEFAVMSACIASASLAFLLFNFHPAKIFMGDAGSVPLGFLAGAMGLYGWQHGLWPLWFPVLVFSPFIVDASVTLFKRLVRGEKVWQAHRSHYYQRLVQMGWGHRNTAMAEYVLMLAVAISGLLLVKQPMSVVLSVLALWALAYVVLMWLIDKQWVRFLGKIAPGHL